MVQYPVMWYAGVSEINKTVIVASSWSSIFTLPTLMMHGQTQIMSVLTWFLVQCTNTGAFVKHGTLGYVAEWKEHRVQIHRTLLQEARSENLYLCILCVSVRIRELVCICIRIQDKTYKEKLKRYLRTEIPRIVEFILSIIFDNI
jgi:hypothetical protein